MISLYIFFIIFADIHISTFQNKILLLCLLLFLCVCIVFVLNFFLVLLFGCILSSFSFFTFVLISLITIPWFIILTFFSFLFSTSLFTYLFTYLLPSLPLSFSLFFILVICRLFLESNPIPTKKALQLMGKIGKKKVKLIFCLCWVE